MPYETYYILLLFSSTVGKVSHPVQILEFTDLLVSKSVSAFFEGQVTLFSVQLGMESDT